MSLNEGFNQTLILDTNGEQLERFVGFYYCYYVFGVPKNILTEDDLLKIFYGNGASRVYVYVESNIKIEQKHHFIY